MNEEARKKLAHDYVLEIQSTRDPVRRKQLEEVFRKWQHENVEIEHKLRTLKQSES